MTETAAVEGVVRNVNEKGLRLEGAEDWLNFSKPEYRDEPWVDPEVGDSVRLGVTGKWIKTVQLIMPRSDADKPVAATQTISAPGDARGRAIDYNVALKVAGDIYVAAVYQGILPEIPNTGEVTAYARALMHE